MMLCSVSVGESSQSPKTIATKTTDGAAANKTQLPKVLIIGDSISLGYTRDVIELLKDKADVVHHKGNKRVGPNAGPTMRGIEYIDEWLGSTKWDVIHFNWGLWDMYGWRYENVDRSPAAYEKRLDTLVARLKRTGAKLIWATTTPVCPAPEALCKVKISAETERQYLGAALRVMKKHNVKVNDLHRFMSPLRSKYATADNNVHFNREGSRKLAEQVAEHISAALAEETSPTCIAPKTYDASGIVAACKAGDYDKALALAEATAKAYPDRAELADVLFKCAGDLAQASRFAPAGGLYRIVSERFPDFKQIESVRTELAACYYYARQLEQCLEQVKVNLKLYPKSPWVEYWTFQEAQIQFRLWKYADAKVALEKFVADYPSGKYAKDAKAYLNRIDPPMQIDENGIVKYSGKFDKDIRMQAAIKNLPGYKADGFRTLEKRLGVDLKPYTNVLYCFKDAGQNTSSGLKGTTRIIGMNNKPTIIIFFYAETVVTNDEGFHKTTVHEMKHAGFLGIMGQAYHDLPKWIREGLALWGSEDVEKRLQSVLSNEIAGAKNPMVVLDGIEDPDHNYRDYLEDVIAFEWLASKNPANIAAFCRRLVKGEPYQEIWADLSGTSYAEAMAEANAYCRHRVETALGKGYTSFAKLRKESDGVMRAGAAATQKWLSDGGKAEFEQWLGDNAGHVAEPMARLSFARCLIIAGQHTAGRELLKKIIAEDGCRCTLIDDAQFWIGVSYNHERDQVNAGKAFGAYLRDYPNSSYARQIRGKFPVAGPVTR